MAPYVAPKGYAGMSGVREPPALLGNVLGPRGSRPLGFGAGSWSMWAAQGVGISICIVILRCVLLAD